MPHSRRTFFPGHHRKGEKRNKELQNKSHIMQPSMHKEELQQRNRPGLVLQMTKPHLWNIKWNTYSHINCDETNQSGHKKATNESPTIDIDNQAQNFCTRLRSRKRSLPYKLWRNIWELYPVPLNPFMPSGPLYLKSLDRSVSYIRGVWLVFIITMFLKKIWTYHKHCRPWSDAVFRGVWSGSTLFANVPFMGR